MNLHVDLSRIWSQLKATLSNQHPNLTILVLTPRASVVCIQNDRPNEIFVFFIHATVVVALCEPCSLPFIGLQRSSVNACPPQQIILGRLQALWTQGQGAGPPEEACTCPQEGISTTAQRARLPGAPEHTASYHPGS